MVNHFQKNNAITTKLGLTRNLRELIWFEHVDHTTFYPKCFDLKNEEDMNSFLLEFKHNKAQAILQKYLETNNPDE